MKKNQQMTKKHEHRVLTDLEKSLTLTMALENSPNLKKVPFMLEFCKIILEIIN